MAFTLPPLPFDAAALEPHIDAMTMSIHHDKHHQAYVTNLNAALDKAPELFGKSLDDIDQEPRTRCPRRSAAPCATTAAGIGITRSSGGSWCPRAAGSRAAISAPRSARSFGDFAKFREQLQGRRPRPLRLGLGVAHPGQRRRAQDREHAQPGQPADGGQDRALRRRCLGARLLSQVPEPPRRLPHGVLERGSARPRRRPRRTACLPAHRFAMPRRTRSCWHRTAPLTNRWAVERMRFPQLARRRRHEPHVNARTMGAAVAVLHACTQQASRTGAAAGDIDVVASTASRTVLVRVQNAYPTRVPISR